MHRYWYGNGWLVCQGIKALCRFGCYLLFHACEKLSEVQLSIAIGVEFGIDITSSEASLTYFTLPHYSGLQHTPSKPIHLHPPNCQMLVITCNSFRAFLSTSSQSSLVPSPKLFSTKWGDLKCWTDRRRSQRTALVGSNLWRTQGQNKPRPSCTA